MPPKSPEKQDSKEPKKQQLVDLTEVECKNDLIRYCIITITHPTTTTKTTTINTTITHDGKIAITWIKRTLRHAQTKFQNGRFVLGFGVQWLCPTTTGGHRRPAATLQLFHGSECLIFLLQHSTTVPSTLRKLLQHPRVTFVGLWSNLDAAQLMFSPHRLEMLRGMPIDLRHQDLDGRGRGGCFEKKLIPDIAMQVLGLKIEWSLEVCRSNWEVGLREFSEDQVKQASIDAFVAFAIGTRINAWKLNPYSHLEGRKLI